MALTIQDDCINCDVCEPQCPNDAIYMGPEYYIIEPEKCTECVGHHDEPQCMVVCPIDCIVPHPEWKESKGQLMDKFNALMAQKG